MMMKKSFFLWTALSLVSVASALEYELLSDDAALDLVEVKTGTGGLKTLFVDEPTAVTITGLAWGPMDGMSSDIIQWETLVDGKVEASGMVNLTGLSFFDLPDSVDAGEFTVGDRGRPTIEVVLTIVDGSGASASTSMEAFGAGVSILPLIIVLLLAVTTQMVEFSLFSAIFVGSCMVAGEVNLGFKSALDTYLLNSVANDGHGFVVLFSLFLGGVVGMMEYSGGMLGFTRLISNYATNAQLGQFCAFLIGLFVFFDDYANTLLAGKTMRPLTDMLFVSREKLAFIVDATAAPIASLTPVSSWVGYEVGLIQDELDRLAEQEGGEENLTVKTSAMGVFLQSIRFRYYPIFMLVLMATLIFLKRDFGPMLIAERKTQVYERTDGGEGKSEKKSEEAEMEANAPRPDTPLMWYNMVVPVILLVFFIFYLLVKSGDDGSGDQDFIDKLEGSDSYVALLYGTMATAICIQIFYMLQTCQDGQAVLPTPDVLQGVFMGNGEEEGGPRLLMNLRETLDSFIFGMKRIFPALIVLYLAWATGDVMTSVGVDRLFASWIVDGIEAKSLPTLSFVISGFMALATGTSWGTMAILFPLIMVPTYNVSGGDEEIFYATVAGILSGAVAGDHVSPISDTTVLSSLACDCTLLAHVSTQAPYAIVVVIISIIFGTIPIGRDTWPNIIGILLGIGVIVAFSYFGTAQIINPSGSFDPITEVYGMVFGGEAFAQLREDTQKKYNGEEVGDPMKDPTGKTAEGVVEEVYEEPEKGMEEAAKPEMASEVVEAE